jgi:diguanylate cyclase (GGDEF)-like protein
MKALFENDAKNDQTLRSSSDLFVGSSLDFVQHCQELMTREESFKGILKQFVEILGDYFSLTHAVYIHSSSKIASTDQKKTTIRFPTAKTIEESNLQRIKSLVLAIIDKDQDASSGLSTLRVDQDDYYFLVVADPLEGHGFLVWKQPVISSKSAVFRSFTDHAIEPMSMLDFIAKSLQNTCRWLRRLDKTQAMLYEDEVTGLYNYRYLDVAIDGELRRLHRFHAPFSLLFIDLDDFKKVNDVFGHITGSQVLRQAGETIKLAVRDVDSVIRFGGDEFVVVLLGTGSRQALQAAERIRSRVQDAVYKSEDLKPIKLTVSVGVASCPEHGRDRQSILRLADETMYASKKSGKNRVMMVSSSERTHSNSLKDSKT